MIAVSLSVPVRQSYLMGVIPETERSRAAGLASFPSQLGGSFGPYLGGYMMQHIELVLPLEAAALLQAISAILFYFFFQSVRPPEETATISVQARFFDTSAAHR
jgi:MFS family permease